MKDVYNWMAPEIMAGLCPGETMAEICPGEKSDLYGLTACLWEILSGKHYELLRYLVVLYLFDHRYCI